MLVSARFMESMFGSFENKKKPRDYMKIADCVLGNPLAKEIIVVMMSNDLETNVDLILNKYRFTIMDVVNNCINC